MNYQLVISYLAPVEIPLSIYINKWHRLIKLLIPREGTITLFTSWNGFTDIRTTHPPNGGKRVKAGLRGRPPAPTRGLPGKKPLPPFTLCHQSWLPPRDGSVGGSCPRAWWSPATCTQVRVSDPPALSWARSLWLKFGLTPWRRLGEKCKCEVPRAPGGQARGTELWP